MKIVYLHQYFNTPDMPGGTRSYEMARRLVLRGHRVQMVTSSCRGGRRGWLRTNESGIEVHWCSVPYSNRMSYRRRMWSFAQFCRLAAGKAASLQADVVFATSTPLSIAVPAVYAARRLSAPMVFEVRDLWPEIPIAVGALGNPITIALARRLERFAYRNAAHVVALSPGMKAGVVAAGYPAENVTVIPNGCDLPLFQVGEEAGRRFRAEHDWLAQRPLVVYTGALGLLNGVCYLARLAAAVRRRNPEICFLVVGTGGEEEKVRRTAERLGVLGRNFFMLPPLPKTEMPAVLSAADMATSLFVDLEKNWVNSANKVFDALAAARPIAINHQGWHAERIRGTGCGLVLDPHDIESAAEKLTAALCDKQWLANAAAAAGRVGREYFDRDKLCDRLESVLSEAKKGSELFFGRSRTKQGCHCLPASSVRRGLGDRKQGCHCLLASSVRRGLGDSSACEPKNSSNPFFGIFGRRAIDTVGAAAMLVLAAPVMLLLAGLIRLTMGRPVLFRQLRAGRDGRPFTLYKFRSMREATGNDGRPLADAVRLTRLGRLLRRTSLDELPQLLNVLRGEMSIFGPRPLLMKYLDRYTPQQARRLRVKPGLTGWSQVNGRNAMSWEEKLALDSWYADHQSLRLDVQILLRTFGKVLRGEGINHPHDATMPEFTGSPASATTEVRQ